MPENETTCVALLHWHGSWQVALLPHLRIPGKVVIATLLTHWSAGWSVIVEHWQCVSQQRQPVAGQADQKGVASKGCCPVGGKGVGGQMRQCDQMALDLQT